MLSVEESIISQAVATPKSPITDQCPTCLSGAEPTVLEGLEFQEALRVAL